MKHLIVSLLTFASLVSMTAFAGNIDSIRNGGTFATYSRLCGYEVEKSGTNLYLTAVANQLYPGISCTDMGKVFIYECNSHESSDCYSGSSSLVIRILDDGNFIEFGRETAKFIYFN